MPVTPIRENGAPLGLGDGDDPGVWESWGLVAVGPLLPFVVVFAMLYVILAVPKALIVLSWRASRRVLGAINNPTPEKTHASVREVVEAALARETVDDQTWADEYVAGKEDR